MKRIIKQLLKSNVVIIMIILLIIFVLLKVYSYIQNRQTNNPDGIYINNVKINENITVGELLDICDMRLSTNRTLLAINEDAVFEIKKHWYSTKSLKIDIENELDTEVEINNCIIDCIRTPGIGGDSGKLLKIYKNGYCITKYTDADRVLKILGSPNEINTFTNFQDWYYDNMKIEFRNDNVNEIKISKIW